ncbi:DUF2637 domain-containing protein [Verrucosispora sp. WMMC514]|uniref:DUF2637 domain-containing protein n=1 Tax=Verrucosispora sp. WMMC514 TaxID=3015156 RepID=UPI00248CBF60|nr:DUF2637 domain-containing protein [Verrucosispora sp. WMMC514]WBB94151.1 DUF2637 domain-containing protein [Verrucosispora sp. WMMC514]
MELQREPLPVDEYAPAADGQAWWLGALRALEAVPGWVWAIATTALLLTSVVLLLLVVRRRKTSNDDGGGLFRAAITATILFLAAVFFGSFKGLAAFGRDTLHWTGGLEYLVPATLDGVAIACALLALAAIKKRKDGTAAHRVVWLATLSSAAINFDHEANGPAGSTVGGAYLGLLSLLGMLLLHIILDLLTGSRGARVERVKPRFGLRWITSPGDSAAAWLAWQNFPPAPLPTNATADRVARYASVRHALSHLEVVRRARRIKRHTPAGAEPAEGWARINPWLRVRQLGAALVDLRNTSTAELSRVRADAATDRATAAQTIDELRRQVADLNTLLEVAAAETTAAEQRATDAEQRAATADTARRTAEADANTARLDAARAVAAAEQTAALAMSRADQVTADLAAARELVGQLRHETAAATTAAEQHAAETADLRRQLTDEQTAHRATLSRLTAAATELPRQRDREQPPRSSRRQPADDTNTGEQPAGKWPTCPPWSPEQLRAFELRDADKKRWTWPELEREIGAASSTIRRWFASRTKHTATPPTVPALPIDPPATPTTAVNGSTPVPA